jgi:hypothetical protein
MGRPSMPSCREVAAELGIVPETCGWREKVGARRGESKIHAAYLEALAKWEQSEEAASTLAFEAQQRAAKEARNQKLRDAGAEYLIGVKLTKSKRGTYAGVFGRRASPISRRACEALGLVPGPGND